jgi:hypothetical protein
VSDEVKIAMPVFVIKAKDVLAVEAVQAYYALCVERGLLAQADEVQLAIAEIGAWQDRHQNDVRLPTHKHVPAALSAPSEPVPDGPRVWAGPEPFVIPEDILAVRDKEGFVWQREPGGVATVGLWWRRSTGAWCDDDRRLVDLCGPLTEVVEEATP